MSLQYLLDTNIISEPLKPKPNPNVSEKLQRHRTETAIATTVWHELWFGCSRLPGSRRRDAMEYYLLQVIRKTIPFFSYDTNAATWHAQERVRLVALGQTPPFLDGQIAAIAKTNNLILVTGNVSDYQNFTELQIENWYDNSNK